jgi:pyruvate-ferredoxin/flavodoxin oxidoreductase
MAEGLLASGDGKLTVSEILARARADTSLRPITADSVAGIASATGAPATAAPREAPAGSAATAVLEAPAETAVAVEAIPAEAPAEEEEEEALVMEPYIETARCTSCDECININKKMFAYDENKQAYIKDARAGTFAEIVQSAEKCTAEIIHPGTPLNPKEKDLEKWIERAAPFN